MEFFDLLERSKAYCNIYISDDGNDEQNTCSEVSPFKTLKRAIEHALSYRTATITCKCDVEVDDTLHVFNTMITIRGDFNYNTVKTIKFNAPLHIFGASLQISTLNIECNVDGCIIPHNANINIGDIKQYNIINNHKTGSLIRFTGEEYILGGSAGCFIKLQNYSYKNHSDSFVFIRSDNVSGIETPYIYTAFNTQTEEDNEFDGNITVQMVDDNKVIDLSDQLKSSKSFLGW